LRSGPDPVNQTSGRAFGPGLTVARHLEGAFARELVGPRERQLRVMAGVLETLYDVERRRQQGVDISPDV
jgi:hypothetical protein